MKLFSFLKTDIGRSLLIAIAWQLAVALVFLLIYTLQYGSSHVDYLDHTMRFDSGWYKQIINGSYWDLSNASPAFFPLFPFLIKILQLITLHLVPLPLLGLLLNTVCVFFAVLALFKIADHLKLSRYRGWVVLLFLTFPSAFMMHEFYSEALFCALAFWSYLFALRREWWKMGIVLALVTATRIPGLIFVGLCGLEFFNAYNWKIKNIFNKNLLWFLLAPVGMLGYFTFLYIVRGDFFAALHAFDMGEWTYHKQTFDLLYAYIIEVQKLMEVIVSPALQLDTYRIMYGIVVPILTVTVIALSVYAIWKLKDRKLGRYGIPLGIFGLVCFIETSANGNVVSAYRYMLPTIILYLVPIMLLKTHVKNEQKIKNIITGLAVIGIIISMYAIQIFYLTISYAAI